MNLLELSNLRKLFPLRAGLFAGPVYVHALDGVSLSLAKGEVLAIVGESGCGKSTLALTLMNLEKPTQGTILFKGQDVTHLQGQKVKALRRQVQMIFQDPYESLDPSMTIAQLVAEPLYIHNIGNKTERLKKVKNALEDVGLSPTESYMHRYPHELSGGQRQRVVIASALVLEPELLIADEPVSMLDVSIRADILNLLSNLQKQKGISFIFITHDLSTAASFADRIAVMYLGRIVEIGDTKEVLQHPEHPYTKALLSVAPVPNPRLRKQRQLLEGDPPNPINIPKGCRFAPRCPVVINQCKDIDPQLEDVSVGHQVACILGGRRKEEGGN
jgi:oligopeptide/dipeptide ABC transporter ATP-binding protein